MGVLGAWVWRFVDSNYCNNDYGEGGSGRRWRTSACSTWPLDRLMMRRILKKIHVIFVLYCLLSCEI